MRKLMLIAVLAAGCADGTTLSMDAPDPGMAHDGAAGGGAGGAGGSGPACDAAVETLSGTATYVAGSAMAVDPAAATGLSGTPTCADLVKAITPAATVDVINGKLGDTLTEEIGAAHAGTGCNYTLRRHQDAVPPSMPCAVTVDYVLVIL